MRKHQSDPPGLPTDDPPPRRAWMRTVATVLLGLLIAPLLYEGLQLCVANWRGMSGEVVAVETPVLTTLGDLIHDSSAWSRRTTTSLLRDPAWRAGPTVAFFLVWS